jgi:hypothetical protein
VIVKTVAFVMGLSIGAVGAVGIVARSALVWIGERFATSAIPLLALGGFVAYACAPARRAA